MIHTFSFYPIDSRMYIMIQDNSALIIDPFVSEDALELLHANSISDIVVILTHEHYDHISGTNWLRDSFPQVQVLSSQKCAEAIEKPSRNLSAYWQILFGGRSKEEQEYVERLNLQPYICEADQTFEGETELKWQGHILHLQKTPGHSKGSICILFDGNILFSGDSLVTGHRTVTRLPGSSKKDFLEKTIPYLKGLAPDTMVYPGHGDCQVLSKYDEMGYHAVP